MPLRTICEPLRRPGLRCRICAVPFAGIMPLRAVAYPVIKRVAHIQCRSGGTSQVSQAETDCDPIPCTLMDGAPVVPAEASLHGAASPDLAAQSPQDLYLVPCSPVAPSEDVQEGPARVEQRHWVAEAAVAATVGTEGQSDSMDCNADLNIAAASVSSASPSGHMAAVSFIATPPNLNLTSPNVTPNGNIYYYQWPRTRTVMHRPPFQEDYPVPENSEPNINSFLGAKDTYAGKLFVQGNQYRQFMQDYLHAYKQGYMMFLSEKYYHEPFRYFAELDFEWTYDLDAVLAITNQVINLVAETVRTFYKCNTNPAYVVSMRTPYKVHLNFPAVITTEPLAHMCRDMIVGRCRAELDAVVAVKMDWDRVIDFPHGSFRLLGSKKARHMDHDPPWVRDKAYYPVVWKEEESRWAATGFYHALMMQASIFPDVQQLHAFESSDLFRDMAYMDVESYRAKLEVRRKRRQEQREAVTAAGGPAIKLRLRVLDNETVAVRLMVREDKTEKPGKPPSLPSVKT